VTQRSNLVNESRPLEDPRWTKFVDAHPRSSVFHTAGWLEALRRTYDYEPIAFTTSPSDAGLQSAVVFCRVDSWLTGRRLVSLPFSDHCNPLVRGQADLDSLISALQYRLSQGGFRYAEMRSTESLDTITLPPQSIYSYCFHHIDLRPDLDALFRSCHKNSTQKKIHRAQHEGLTYEDGRSEFLLDSFYRLLLLTRRRHGVPPQPKRWFRCLIDCLGGALKIRGAFKDAQPIAAILTLRHKDTLVYKYGCSDAQFHRLGGMHLLFWRSIEEAKRDGLCVFDLGRSEWSQAGLIAFKDRWGATRSGLRYSRLSDAAPSLSTVMPASNDWKKRIAKGLFQHLPDRVLCSAGALLYRHVG
jgi:hypothetical protein